MLGGAARGVGIGETAGGRGGCFFDAISRSSLLREER